MQKHFSVGRFCGVKCKNEWRAKNLPKDDLCRNRAKGGKRLDLGDRYFRSSWEANWARYLNWLLSIGEIVSWEYESETFEFQVKKGSRFYTPDFKVVEKDGRTTRYEIKGYMDQKSRTKLKRMERYYPDCPITIIDCKIYHGIANKISHLIPGWEKVGSSRRARDRKVLAAVEKILARGGDV